MPWIVTIEVIGGQRVSPFELVMGAFFLTADVIVERRYTHLRPWIISTGQVHRTCSKLWAAGHLESVNTNKLYLAEAEFKRPYCLGFSWSCTLALLVRTAFNPPLHGRFDSHVTMEEPATSPYAEATRVLRRSGSVRGLSINQATVGPYPGSMLAQEYHTYTSPPPL